MMKTIIVNDKKTLDELYDDWAFTLIGVSPTEESLSNILEWIKSLTEVKNETFYIVSGSLMNMAYGLIGDVAYPEMNCNLVCMKLSDMENANALAIPRFQIGGRWFTDIVENNARHQRGE